MKDLLCRWGITIIPVFPGYRTSMTMENLARVVYNGSYIGNNTNENFRRVLTHEFGHFMGLHHTGCTYPNDGIEDTPPVATSKWPIANCEGNYTDWGKLYELHRCLPTFYCRTGGSNGILFK